MILVETKTVFYVFLDVAVFVNVNGLSNDFETPNPILKLEDQDGIIYDISSDGFQILGNFLVGSTYSLTQSDQSSLSELFVCTMDPAEGIVSPFPLLVQITCEWESNFHLYI